MENIRNQVLQILPNTPPDTLNSLLAVLVDLGVTSVEDLKYVLETDLSGLLRPIQCRKLIEAWKQSESSVPVVATPNAVNERSCSTTLGGASADLVDVQDDWVKKFSFPCQKMPEELMRCLHEGKRPTPKGRWQFIRETSKTIFKICPKPGKKNLERIARKAITLYPGLSDIWCGEMVAGGCESLTKSFVVKFENLNRRGPFSALKRKLQVNEKNKDSNKVSNLGASSCYGCPNWQPECLPKGENERTQLKKQRQMIKSSLVKGKDSLDEQSLILLDQTYFSQRKDINDLQNISFLMNSWPLLFREKGFFAHFKTLTGIDICEMLAKEINEKTRRVVKYFMIREAQKNFKILKDQENEDAEFKLMISLLLEYFNEKQEAVFISVDSSLNTKDVENMVLLPSTPCLIFSSDKSVGTYTVTVNKKVINEDIESFQRGFFMMFAAYYILNIEYPEMACATLEFIQRCFLKINPDRGSKVSKSKKKQHIVNPKVLTLLNKLMDLEFL